MTKNCLVYKWYKFIAAVCLLIVVIQVYVATQFFGASSKDNVQVPQTKWSSSSHSLKQPLVETDGGVPLQEQDHWNPDAIRKKEIDDTFEKAKLDSSFQCPSLNRDAQSAYKRAKSVECKEAIYRVSCLLANEKLFAKSLPRFCPLRSSGKATQLGCFNDDAKSRDLSGAHKVSPENSPSYCINLCLASGYKYAGVQYGKECWCGNTYAKYGKAADILCQAKPCPGDHTQSCGGHLVQLIYQTGYGDRPSGHENSYIVPAALDTETSSMVRILFMLTWNGRAIRQVKRLFKQIYHVNHYYYIHVDAREEFMYREVLKLANDYDNVRVVKNRIATIWGGATLLQMLLQTMSEALSMTDWHWDFYLNLSESDYPVKSIEELTAFLSANRDKNFLKSHGPDTPTFMRKQGLVRTFYECDYHLWRVGNRSLPADIRVDGGSDWICLNRKFVKYVTTSTDELVTGLKQYYKFAILPAESYFHTVLQNSEYCESFVDNNLHKTNWNRKRGCLCQYKHIVDWCGCSPMDFTDRQQEKDKLLKTKDARIFFARKFEAVVSTRIVNWLDEWIHGPYPPGTAALDTYWQSVFHSDDSWKLDQDSQYTYYMSLARNTAKKLTRIQQQAQCNIELTLIKQVHLINQEDSFIGLAVHAQGHVADSTANTLDWEAQLKPIETFTLLKHIGPASRLKYIKVGSSFDLKERIYRDYGTMVGSKPKNLTVVQTWEGGDSITISVLVIDPLGYVGFNSDIEIPRGNDHTIITTVDLPKPLMPGRWKAKVIYDSSVVAEKTFLILPEIYNKHKFSGSLRFDYKLEEYIKSMERKASEESSLYIFLSDEDKFYRSPSELQTALSKTQSELLDWVDSLVLDFWTPVGACSVDYKTDCGAITLCNTTSWSSYSRDPKSEIGAINPQTGKIFLFKPNSNGKDHR